MTRVRVEVHDDEQLDLPRLKQLSGVSGYVKQGQQHQLIVGPGKAAQVVDAMRALMGVKQPPRLTMLNAPKRRLRQNTKPQ